MNDFDIKDSGARKEFSSGMVRDMTEDKIEYLSMRLGPMFKRWAAHLTKGRKKYPDVSLGVPNWTLAAGEAELLHAKESFSRHQQAWLDGDTDEDHAAAMFFNINLVEYIKEKMAEVQAFRDATDADPEVIAPEVQKAIVTERLIVATPHRVDLGPNRGITAGFYGKVGPQPEHDPRYA
jgi:hypothetical protein